MPAGNATLRQFLDFRREGMAMLLHPGSASYPLPAVEPLPPGVTVPELAFYIHDHLGNTRVLYANELVECNEDSTKYIIEHALDYFPYGRTLRHYTWKRDRFQTTHHERDLESGLDYRGARFYDSDVPGFLSVDPLAGDFAAWSSYSYAFDNPIRFVDPDGKSADDVIDVDKETGKISVTKAPGNDIVRLVNNGVVEDSYAYGGNGSFLSDFKITEGIFNGKNGMALVTTNNAEKAQTFFEFAAQSNVEFGKLDVQKGDKVFSVVTTTHHPENVASLSVMVNKFSKEGFTGLKQVHSHPDGQSVPSGYYGYEKGNPNSFTPIPSGHPSHKKGDAHSAREMSALPGFQNMKFEVYNPICCTLTTYDGVSRAKIHNK